MKKAVVALAMMVLASPAFAAEYDEILIPDLSALPFIVTAAGDLSSGYITNWGALSQEKGNFSSANNRVADQLQEHKCAIHFGVARNAKTGRIDPKDGLATIACQQPGGTVVATDVPGAFLDSTGTIGLKNNDVGEKAFFISQTAIRIPVGIE